MVMAIVMVLRAHDALCMWLLCLDWQCKKYSSVCLGRSTESQCSNIVSSPFGLNAATSSQVRSDTAFSFEISRLIYMYTYSRSQKGFRFDNSKRKLLSVPFGYVSFRSVPFCIAYAVYKNACAEATCTSQGIVQRCLILTILKIERSVTAPKSSRRPE